MNEHPPNTDSDTIRAAKIVALGVLVGAGIVGGSIAIASANNDELVLILFAFTLILLFKMYRIWTGQPLLEQLKKSAGAAIREEWSPPRKPRDER